MLGQYRQAMPRLKFLHDNKIIERTSASTSYNTRFYSYRLARYLKKSGIDIPVKSATLNKSLTKFHSDIKEAKMAPQEKLNVKRFIQNYVQDKDINQDSLDHSGAVIDMIVRNLRRSALEISFEDFMTYYPEQEIENTDRLFHYVKRYERMPEVEVFYFIHQDSMGGRIYTPYTNLKKDIRRFIKLNGNPIAELDVSACQPNILANILCQMPGEHDFTEFFNSHYNNFYPELNKKLQVDDPKTYTLKMINGEVKYASGAVAEPHKKFCELFPKDGEILTVIKQLNLFKNKNRWGYTKKGKAFPRFHTNVYLILTTEEVRIFSRIWETLEKAEISFLSIHDAILVESQNIKKAKAIMEEILSKEFKNYRIKENNYETIITEGASSK
jgi:hypothetical protein